MSPQKGFTLVELLIVVGIIGLLVTIGVSAYSSAAMNGRNTQRKASLSQVAKALEMYANDHGGTYPATTASGIAWWGACSGFGSHPDTGSTGWIPNLAPAYAPALPHDPNTSKPQNVVANCLNNPNNACYLYSSNGTDYKMISYCIAEGTISTSDPFYDATHASTYMVASPGGRTW